MLLRFFTSKFRFGLRDDYEETNLTVYESYEVKVFNLKGAGGCTTSNRGGEMCASTGPRS